MTRPEALPPIRDLAKLFSGPNCKAAISSIDDFYAVSAAVVQDASAEDEVVRRILEISRCSADAIGLLDELPKETIQGVFVFCLLELQAMYDAALAADPQQVH